MNTATAPASGAPWTLKPGKAAQATYAYATGVAGAGLAKDGTPISTWSGSPGLGFHYGIDPSTPDGKIPQTGCCLYTPDDRRRLGERPGVGRIPLERERGPGALRERDRSRRPAGRPEARAGIGDGEELDLSRATGRRSRAASARAASTSSTARATRRSRRSRSGRSTRRSRRSSSRPTATSTRTSRPHPTAGSGSCGSRTGRSTPRARTRRPRKVGAVNTLKAPGQQRPIYRLNGEGSAGPARPDRQRRAGASGISRCGRSSR